MDIPRHTPEALPQRIPAAPDVPEIPGIPLDDDADSDGPAALARIADALRDEEAAGSPRSDGFDFDAVLEAVREVSGVREAAIRANANGVHTLRLDLFDNADAARVSREVARLLKLKMGLAAEPRRTPAPPDPDQDDPHPFPAGPTSDLGSAPPAQMPVAGSVPLPRAPLPAGATEQLGGPLGARAGASGGLSSGALSSTGLGNGPGSGPTGPGGGSTGPAGAEAVSQPAGTPARHDSGTRHPVTVPRMRSSLDGRAHAASDDALPAPLRRPPRAGEPPRVVLDEVQVRTLGIDAKVEVRLTATGRQPVFGISHGPNVDGYLLRLAAQATASAIDQLLAAVPGPEVGRCYVEHAAVVPLAGCEVAVVVVLLTVGGWVQQLTGSALVSGDPRQAVVRATLAAVNRRVDALLA